MRRIFSLSSPDTKAASAARSSQRASLAASLTPRLQPGQNGAEVIGGQGAERLKFSGDSSPADEAVVNVAQLEAI
jgi:hypothetical protein